MAYFKNFRGGDAPSPYSASSIGSGSSNLRYLSSSELRDMESFQSSFKSTHTGRLATKRLYEAAKVDASGISDKPIDVSKFSRALRDPESPLHKVLGEMNDIAKISAKHTSEKLQGALDKCRARLQKSDDEFFKIYGHKEFMKVSVSTRKKIFMLRYADYDKAKADMDFFVADTMSSLMKKKREWAEDLSNLVAETKDSATFTFKLGKFKTVLKDRLQELELRSMARLNELVDEHIVPLEKTNIELRSFVDHCGNALRGGSKPHSDMFLLTLWLLWAFHVSRI